MYFKTTLNKESVALTFFSPDLCGHLLLLDPSSHTNVSTSATKSLALPSSSHRRLRTLANPLQLPEWSLWQSWCDAHHIYMIFLNRKFPVKNKKLSLFPEGLQASERERCF